MGGNECRANVGKVCTHGLRRQNSIAAGNRARQCHGAVKPLANFLDQCEGAFFASMSARACGHCNQTISPFFNGLVCKFIVDDVMQHHATITVSCLVNVFARTQ